MSKRLAVLAVLVSAALVAGATFAGAATSPKVKASMSGKKELEKGSTNGTGTFSGTFRNGKLCYTLKVSATGNPLAAHIHKGTSKQNGDIAVDLLPVFKSGTATKCVKVKASVASAIRSKPAGYYVNVHTKSFPKGAIRGQLSSAA